MTKKEIFAAIKSANQIVDLMAGLYIGSSEYANLNQILNHTLDGVSRSIKRTNMVLRLSWRTGHYYITETR